MIYYKDAIQGLKDMIVSDPPYKVTAKGTSGSMGGIMATQETKNGNIFKHNDAHISTWYDDIFRLLKDGDIAYIMTNQVNLQEYINTLTEAGFSFIKCLIWDKGNKITSRYYMNQFEYIYILFLRKGSYHCINNPGTADILKVPNKKPN